MAIDAGYQQGSANRLPWSGNWWPDHEKLGPNMYDNGGPLNLYDWYVYKTRGYNPNSQGWEYVNHRKTGNQAEWAGSCHAWAAAAITTAPPPASGVSRGGIHFSQDALEGLITALNYDPGFQMLPGGQRSYTDNQGAAEFKDMNPAWMHYLLEYYIDKHHYPFIMDTSAGASVWNFPVFAYNSWSQKNNDGSVNVTTRVWFTDAQAGVNGSKHFHKDYTYRLWETANGTMDGQWTGASVNDHPDFAWVPTGTKGNNRNPNIDERIVEEILGYNV